jgi:hypothetical protein
MAGDLPAVKCELISNIGIVMSKYKIIGSSKKVTESDIQRVEKALNIKFPKSLKDFYLMHNGGKMSGEGNIFLDTKKGKTYDVRQFLPILYKKKTGDSLLEDSYQLFVVEKKLIPPNFIPFAENCSGFQYCIDSKTEEVFFSNFEHMERPKGPMELVTKSITYFINGMVTEDEVEKFDISRRN